MKTKTYFFLILVTTMLAACGDNIPTVIDPHSPVVDGKQTTPKDFLDRYCSGQTANPTCEKVKNAMAKDATKGTLPKGW